MKQEKKTFKTKWKLWLIGISTFLSKTRSGSTVKKFLISLFAFNILLITYILSLPYLGEEINLQPGDIATKEIRVFQNIYYTDVKAQQVFEKQAYEKERFVFDLDYKVLYKFEESFRLEASTFLQSLKEKKTYREIIKRIRSLAAWNIRLKKSLQQLKSLNSYEEFLPWVISAGTIIFNNFGVHKGLIPKHKSIKRYGASIRPINNVNSEEELVYSYDRIIYPNSLYYATTSEKIQELLIFSKQNTKKKIEELLLRWVISYFHKNPYLTYNKTETKFRKKIAAQSIKPILKVLRKGLVVAKRGEVIDKAKYKKITILNKHLGQTNVYFIFGQLILQLIFALGIAHYIFRFSQAQLGDLSSNIILYSLILFVLLISLALNYISSIKGGQLPLGLFVPMGYFTIMTAILLGARLTLGIGLYLSVLIFFVSGNDPTTLMLCLVSVLSGIYIAEKTNKRSKILLGGAMQSLVLILVSLSSDMMTNTIGELTSLKVMIALINGVVGSILVLGILPLYESIFNIATVFRLMELADFNHPLLRKMATVAPSTYTHSLMVANLSERAVAAIDGDILLTKVGCLFHDIGKMKNPSFYAENKHLFPSSQQFKKLGPIKSAQLITNHVIDGIEMGRLNRLPEKVISFIPEHHGTTMIQYFYHKELEKVAKGKTNRTVDKKNFSYPGPKPQTKETAIVMIADSLEAASRSLKSFAREKFIELIDVIIENKLSEDQFEECPLTMAELANVKIAFLDVLLSSYHDRPAYPKMNKTKKLEDSLGKNISANDLKRGKKILL